MSPGAEPGGPARLLLHWYDANGRQLPWRVRSGRPDPYAVWLSEVMLQQTTVAAVGRYFTDFLRRWPTVEALAAAPREEVLAAWAGLGYYARARNLHACAQVVAKELGGRFPSTAQELRKLPGIGPYTAGAIAAIAFGEPVAAVDANAERVIARFRAIETPLPDAKPEIRRVAQELVPLARPGDFAQALMDLGSMICTPRRPDCMACPWREPCVGLAKGMAERLPRKVPRRAKPAREGDAWLILREDGAVLLRRRPDKGLLGGMVELPSAGWDGMETVWPGRTPFDLAFVRCKEDVRHVFTHFSLMLRIWRTEYPVSQNFAVDAPFFWQPRSHLRNAGLPGVMRKAAVAALGEPL